MSKKIILVLFCAILFLGARFASASLVINEIMYYPPVGQHSGDWFEVYNNGDTDVIVLSDKNQHDIPWKFSKVGLISKYYINSPDFTIKKGEYVIFSDDSSTFNSDYTVPSQVVVIDSTIGLSNSNKTTLQILDENGFSVTSAEYDPSIGFAAGDGNSLQKISGAWVASTPTPGVANEDTSVVEPPSDTTGGGTTSTTTTTTPPEPKPKVIENPTMKVKILASTLAFTGEPLEMQTKILGYSNENVVLGRAYWNFGDGASLMQVNNFEKFSHTYYYPGEYAVFLEYYLNSFSKTPEATSKIIIKVLPTTVTISKVGDAKDFFIELTNNASSDIDISNWVVNASGKIFILPKNSVIMSKKQMTISGKITGFVYGDQYNLKLLSGTGELISDYNIPLASTKILAIKPSSEIKPLAENNPKNSITPALPEPSTALSPSDQVPVESLSANALEGTGSNKSYFFFWGFVVLLVVSGGAVYYIRQGKNISKVGDDFKILDE